MRHGWSGGGSAGGNSSKSSGEEGFMAADEAENVFADLL